MNFLPYCLTTLSTIIFGLVAAYFMPVFGWLIFCWQCGTKETNQWLFWPMAFLLALGPCYLFSKLPGKFGGENLKLSAGVLLVLMIGLSLVVTLN
ncbi:hypothetical protein [Neolewinella agarilytica]|uniref:Uncharacterized protein n=1 Tax=Neolewinella agarilytica TaxID=478744 RepID=A0A1H9G8X5_9BACT|nr:hypothetical protein [Neolewinella agarilytica]SEQ46514.1 hypothetical protein SAMN05444359_11086 [Neolewinella agarilytica]